MRPPLSPSPNPTPSDLGSSQGITRAIVDFCRFARSRGLKIGVQETLDAVSAAGVGLLPNKNAFRLALRSLLCTSKDDRDRFDLLFEIYWGGARDVSKQPAPSSPSSRVQRKPSQLPLLAMAAAPAESSPESEGKSTHGASARERLQKTDFSKVPEHDQELLERLAVRLWRQMSLRASRRLKASRSKRQVHLRRTIRRSIPHGGDPVDLCYRGRKPQRPRLALLLDVSGSMDHYSFFLLRFVYALQRHFQRVDSFAFSTRLACLTPALRARQLGAGLKALSEAADAWSSGTRIGDCLREFNDGYADRVLSRRSLAIILSDGLDTGAPELLEQQLRRIKRRCHKLIWLNPLKGMAGYQPLARGMHAALPLIDVFLSAHNLQSLLEVEKHLIDV